jgi:hypothetical protein
VDNSTPKRDEKPAQAEKASGKLSPAEIRLYVAHWAEIQQEMNRILAQEVD